MTKEELKQKARDNINLDDREMHILWRTLLYYWENKDFGDDHELRHKVNVLREKMSAFMIGD